MARKRKRVVTKIVPNIKVKGEYSAPAPPPPPAPKKPEPFPVKALIKVFHNLGIITATSFRLASLEFETIYQEHFAEIFKGYNLPQPLSLELRIQYANGTVYFLKDCLNSWMPAHLVYDDYAKKFVTVDNLGKAFLKDIGAWEETREASRTPIHL